MAETNDDHVREFYDGAEMGNCILLQSIYKNHISNLPYIDFNFVAKCAARLDNMELLKLALKWGADDINAIAEDAARYGNFEICIELHNQAPSILDANRIIRGAALYGDVEFCKICKTMGATDYNAMAKGAAANGDIELIRLAIDWGADNYDAMIAFASVNGKSKALELIKTIQITAKSSSNVSAVTKYSDLIDNYGRYGKNSSWFRVDMAFQRYKNLVRNGGSLTQTVAKDQIPSQKSFRTHCRFVTFCVFAGILAGIIFSTQNGINGNFVI